MRCAVKPLFITFPSANRNTVTHVERNADLVTLRSLYGSLAKHRIFIGHRNVIVSRIYGLGTFGFAEFFENGEKNMLAMFVNYVLQRYTNYVREEYREIITQLVMGMPDVQITQMGKVKEVFNHWRYARNMYGARAKMYNCRIPEREITETMDLIQECVSAEEFYEAGSRKEALRKIEKYFGSKESHEYNPDVAHIYLEEMGQEKRWILNKENLKKWCLTGISSAHRCDLRNVLLELAQFLGKSAVEATEMTDTIEHGQATPVCTFTEVYYLIITMTPKDISLLFSQIDLSSPAGIAYCTYRDASETVQQSYVRKVN